MIVLFALDLREQWYVGPAFQKSWESVLGQGVFNSDGTVSLFQISRYLIFVF